MALFDTFSRSKKELDKAIKQKIDKKIATKTNSKNNNLLDRIQEATKRVNENLSEYLDDYVTLTTNEDIVNYFNKILENGICAIDTETTGLNYFSDMIVGVCLYTPGMKASYIPLNHRSPVYLTRIEEQGNIDLVKDYLERCIDSDVKFIYHNGKFDLNILKTFLGRKMNCPYWDTLVGSYLITNDEYERSLKMQYAKYCSHKEDNEKVKTLNKFNELFDGITFDMVPIKVAVLYAARDAWMTYELYLYQKEFFEQKENEDVYKLFREIEVPLVEVTASMQRLGVSIDYDKVDSLTKEYTKKLEDAKALVFEEISKFDDLILKYRLVNFNSLLDDPINIESPKQLAVLLYDILKVEHSHKDTPRGTGEEILKEINIPLTKAILEFRAINKLMNTYITALPNKIEPTTGKIHASFNQNGADTGRFSSSDPNLQNIPRDGGIRTIFKATEGYVLLGSDYSQQEPRILAHLSKDESLLNAYKEGKDIYAFIASITFHVPYEECQEFYFENGKKTDKVNKEGKKRRTQIKSVVLGIMYGRGTASVAEQLSISREEAQVIINAFFDAFPGIKKYVEDCQGRTKKIGYTTTVWGRRRYLKYIMMEPYDFKYGINRPINFDPLFDSDDEIVDEVSTEDKSYYINKLSKASFFQRKKIMEEAEKQGIIITDNTGYVAEAERQCVNSEVQGSAADMTKKAMVALYRDERLRKLGYRLLMSVHDETIGECPYENRHEVGNLVKEIMIEANDRVKVPMKCDVEVSYVWYGPSITD